MSDAEITRAIDSVLVRSLAFNELMVLLRSDLFATGCLLLCCVQGKLSAVNIPDLSVQLMAALDLNGKGSVEKIEFAAKYDTVQCHSLVCCSYA